MQNLKLFVNGPRGFETLLLHELRAILHSEEARLNKVYGGVEVDGRLDAAYLICLHSRLANRVFCELEQAAIDNENRLYETVYQIEWERHLRPDNSLAVAATLSRSRLDHSHFVALKTKDAIVDRLRKIYGSRPSVAKNRPDIQVHINIHRNRASISLDLSGESLHRRGYRTRHAGAPLKENLAAALLSQAGWDRFAASRLRLLDPLCGSGTFVIEAAMIGANIAPGLEREYFGFRRWLHHDETRWQRYLQAAKNRVDLSNELEIFASDFDADALDIARANAERAGVSGLIRFDHQQVAEVELPPSKRETLVICNPPYGRRLQSESGLGQLYRDLGATTRRFAPAQLAIISANPDLLHQLQLGRVSRKEVRNGPLACLFARFDTDARMDRRSESGGASKTRDLTAQALLNRLKKNAKHLQRWARRHQVSCYRLYDADLPEFAFALDRYQSDVMPEQVWYHLQEYQAPASVDAKLAAQRLDLAVNAVLDLFAIPSDHLFVKQRGRQRGQRQYQKLDSRGEFFQVREGEASLLINLSDYLDTGLFLDHRITRERIRRAAQDKRLLNLFCYTGTVGVQAGLGGARSVLNVDLSQKYLDWARENHRLNQLDDSSRFGFMQADIVELLKNPKVFAVKADYDLIFLDPPSFSNSKKMQQTLDTQRDHALLIRQAMALLAPGGMLMFSTNRRGFKIDSELGHEFGVNDITRATIPEDFKRNPRIHHCWEIRHLDA